jgi:hypothetical protein
MAAHAQAASHPTLFMLSISGSSHQEWTFSAAPTADGDCLRTVTSEATRTVTFRTRKSIEVKLSAGRVLPAVVRAIAGAVTLAGANTTHEDCGPTGNETVADCVRSTRSFAGGRLRARSPRAGVLALAEVEHVRLARATCPIEPPDVRQRPLGVVPTLFDLPKQVSMERKVGRITMHVTRTRHKTYGSPEGGTLDERAVWKLVFVRVRA